ncbi:MAG: hypothetical protein D6798_11995 [Deltaproteobacteria bacterium]|nr:MAG: hypothetical protein D6798_11995 [Deltaproteobacteria bacterium]
MAEAGVKHAPDRVVAIERIGGRIVFLEQGNGRAGFQHILQRHAADFRNKGIAERDIPTLLFEALRSGRQVGMQGSRPVYEVTFRGARLRVAITVGDNGFIVGANPVSL